MVNRFVDINSFIGFHQSRKKKNKKKKSATKEQFHVKRVRRHLESLNSGFEDYGVSELNWIVNGHVSAQARSEAAWQLALWYVNSDNMDDVEKSLSYLDLLTELSDNCSARVNPVSVVMLCIDALLTLGRWDEAKALCFGQKDGFGGQNMLLARANLFAYPEKSHLTKDICDELRLSWINTALQSSGLEELHLIDPAKGVHIDNIAGPENLPDPGSDRGLVSVIMPAYNAANFIKTSINSIRNQSWRNLEILVVDDDSEDNTREIVKEIARIDSRVRLMESEVNRGDSYARNLALAQAKGDFVTLLDADDFAHPRKIEIQAEHLLVNHDFIANRSYHMRATPDLKFIRESSWMGPKPNFSSLMFRRRPVLKKMGYWDSVRISGDAEFLARMRCVFGKDKIMDIPSGLVGVSRYANDSLTSKTGPGRRGILYGVRREYFEAFSDWHKNDSSKYIGFPLKKRPFAVPGMLELDAPNGEYRAENYDVIYASDFRLNGGTTISSIEEIRAQSAWGIKSGVIRMDWFRVGDNLPFAAKFRDMLNSNAARLIAFPEEAEAELVVLVFPPAILEKRHWVPKIRAKRVAIRCSQAPLRGEGDLAERIYHPEEVDRRVLEQFGVRGVWYPIGPVVRRLLQEEDADIIISDEYWKPIIDLKDWSDKRTGPVNRVLTIGRHSRDHANKWPETAEKILQIYPERDDINVLILGEAETALDILGIKPSNWTVYGFDEIQTRDYLKKLDVFAYFPDSRLYEAFGRAILEAMAVGVPVILPHRFKVTFQDAALYCEPEEVIDLAKSLCNERGKYHERVLAGRKFVKDNYSHDEHKTRLRKILGKEIG